MKDLFVLDREEVTICKDAIEEILERYNTLTPLGIEKYENLLKLLKNSIDESGV